MFVFSSSVTMSVALQFFFLCLPLFTPFIRPWCRWSEAAHNKVLWPGNRVWHTSEQSLQRERRYGYIRVQYFIYQNQNWPLLLPGNIEMGIVDLCANFLCSGKAHVLRCPSTDRGDMGVLRASWRMWTQAKRKQVTPTACLLKIAWLAKIKLNLFLSFIYHRGWDWLSDGWHNQTGSNSGFLRRKAWDVGEGWGGSSCHAEQWCVCGRDSGSCQASWVYIKLSTTNLVVAVNSLIYAFWSCLNHFWIAEKTTCSKNCSWMFFSQIPGTFHPKWSWSKCLGLCDQSAQWPKQKTASGSGQSSCWYVGHAELLLFSHKDTGLSHRTESFSPVLFFCRFE